MRTTPDRRSDDRGVSATVTHALALGITAILISGLLFTAGALLEDQRENSAREQLLTVGNRIAEDLSRAAVMAQDGGNVTIQARHPRTIAGRPYQVAFLTGSDCDTDQFQSEACLGLELQGSQTSVMVPVRNETAVTFEERTDGSFTIAATANESATPPSVPAIERDLRVGIGDDIGEFSSGQALNLTNRDPIAGFKFTPGQPTVDSVIHFENDTKDLDGVITSYDWDLNGDGTTDQTGREFNHSYSTPGKYTVTLTVTDDDGESDNVSKVISVAGLVYNDDVQAINETSGAVDADLNFSVENKHGADVEILEVLINPYDNDYDELDTASSSREIEIDGDLDTGGDDSAITLYDDGAIVDIADDGSSGSATLSAGSTAEVRFRGFRDAGTLQDMDAEDTFVAMRYEVNGSFYTSQFTLFGGASSNGPPDPDFDSDCSAAPMCTFTDKSWDDGSIQSWEWHFGDGANSSAKNPSYTYATNGTYDVSLTVTDDQNVSSTLSRTVVVGTVEAPVVFAVNAGGSEMTVDGITYLRDTVANPHPFETGDNRDDSTGDSIANTTADSLYQTTRYGDDSGWTCCPLSYEPDPGSFGYDVPVPNGVYEITFKFAEIQSGFWVDPGERVFDANVEGSTKVSGLDIYAQVGDDHAIDYTTTATVSDGTLNVEFFPDSNDRAPAVNAMVVRQLDADSFQEDEGTSGQVVMEAENYHRAVPGNYQDASGDDMGGDSWVSIANGSASNGRALEGQPNNGDSAGDTENGPRLDYYVNVSNTGTYYVWVRMDCPSAGSADDSIHVGFEGQPATFGGSGLNKNASTNCHDASGWMWASHSAGSPTQFNVNSQGEHTVNVWMNDDGVRIDKIILTDNAAYTPPPSGTGPGQSKES